MIKNLIAFSVHNRWLVVLLTALAAGVGIWSLIHLPIDAVPDITNNQVQINAYGPALSAFEMEKQVTYPIENALAGIPGLEYTRSLSRNGFAQVTAVFADKVDIYFARQQVTERLTQRARSFPARRGIPDGTGRDRSFRNLHVDGALRPRAARAAPDGKPGWQSDGDYLTPEGHTAAQRCSKRRPICARCRTGSSSRSCAPCPGVAGVDSLGGYVQGNITCSPIRRSSSRSASPSPISPA